MPPIKIPERVLAWRERQRRGSVMRPKTFKRIKGKARRTGYRTPSAVAGKAYHVTLLSKYLDSHPGDVGVQGLLSKLVRRRRRINSLSKKQLMKRYGTTSKSSIKYMRGKRDIITGKPLRISKATRRAVERNPKSVIIYDKLLGIEARKGHGKFSGQNFKHDFKDKTDAVVLGNPDGSLTIRSKKGKRLWKKFDY